MNQPTNFEIHHKEHLYFAIKAVVSIIFYALLILGIAAFFITDAIPMNDVYLIILYFVILFLALLFRFGLLIGYIRGNAVKVSAFQFPDIYEIVTRQSKQLGLPNIPDVYILQYGGLLNAFATRFLGSNYIVLFSEIVEAAYEEDKKMLDFIIAHELGHIKRKHITKKMILFPGSLVPFLGFAYSRACEYTCDNIAYSLCPEGARNGMLLVASGRQLFKKVNAAEFIKQRETEGGFWFWFSEKLSSHPHIAKRVARFKEASVQKVKGPRIDETTIADQSTSGDHSKYMPK
jgi:Zn-dependent protease with chaperone function